MDGFVMAEGLMKTKMVRVITTMEMHFLEKFYCVYLHVL